MDELKAKWEDWYGELVSSYQWNEVEYKGRRVLYVCGRAFISGDDRALASEFIQVLGFIDSGASASEQEEKELSEFLRSRHAVGNVSFWRSQD